MKKLVSVLSLFLLLAGCSLPSEAEDEGLVIYATRHGETYFNKKDRVQGWSDTFLTDSGVEVAEYLGRGLEGVNFKKAYSSDLGRAIQTAKIILAENGQEDLEIIQKQEFREANYGMFEGDFNKNMANAMATYHGYKDAEDFMTNSPNFFREGADALFEIDEEKQAESADQIVKRMTKGLEEIVEENPDGGDILLVGHGMSITLLVETLTDGTESVDGHLPNASVTKIVYKDGDFNVESIGDMSYVEKGKEK